MENWMKYAIICMILILVITGFLLYILAALNYSIHWNAFFCSLFTGIVISVGSTAIAWVYNQG